MLIENEFTVEADPEALWGHLLDVERVAPCMPGAELTEVVDERTWKGRVNMKFGPVSMSFAGTVTMEERDDATRRVVLKAKGTEKSGKGVATAVATSWLEPGPDSATTVKMQADITLSGPAAQMARGLLPEVSKKLTQQFAECLRDSMRAAQVVPAGAPGSAEEAPAAAPRPVPVAAKPVGGIRLGLSAIWSLVVSVFRRLFGRLFGRRPS